MQPSPVSTSPDETITRMRLIHALRECFGYDEQDYATLDSHAIINSLNATELATIYKYLGV